MCREFFNGSFTDFFRHLITFSVANAIFRRGNDFTFVKVPMLVILIPFSVVG